MNTATIVQKLWSYCDVLRDVGISYGDDLEQLTYLMFLKMAFVFLLVAMDYGIAYCHCPRLPLPGFRKIRVNFLLLSSPRPCSEKFDSDTVYWELMKYLRWSRDRYQDWGGTK
jgi:hypothetical protein